MNLPRPTLPSDLVTRAAAATGICQSRIHSEGRTIRIVRIRWAIFQVLRQRGWSLHEIGDVFGKDHGTVINGLKKSKALLESDPTYRALVAHLTTAPLLVTP